MGCKMIKRFFTVAVLLVSIGCIACAQTKINLASQVKGILPTANGGLGNSTGNAPTASSLLSTPTTCGAGLAAQGILANGNATGCFSVPGSGTVTSVGLTMPSWLSVANTPVTSAGTLTVTAAGSQTSHQVIGTCGTATSFAPCALIAGDIPSLPYLSNASGAANLVMATPNGSSGSPSLRALVGADIPAINLAGTGNGGIAGNLPVGNIAPGTNGQCVITSSSATIWGTCAGTVGEQVLNENTTDTGNIAITGTSPVALMTYSITAGQINTLGKTIRIRGFGRLQQANTADALVYLFIGTQSIQLAKEASVTGGSGADPFTMEATCTVTATGSNGALTCAGTAMAGNGGAFPLAFGFDYNGTGVSGVNLTSSIAVGFGGAFSASNASNTGGGTHLVVELLN